MGNKRFKPEEIVQKLRHVEVLVGQGIARLNAIRQIAYQRPLTSHPRLSCKSIQTRLSYLIFGFRKLGF